MTTRYVGPGGSDANSGLTWALRKLTLNGVEDTPVVAGDTVYVGPGTYRETLTVDVSGTAGNPITYIGDYSGANTDGVGGVVRITGSNNDQTATRANCITATSKNYRTFQGFQFDMTSNIALNLISPQNWVVQNCSFSEPVAVAYIQISGASQSACTIQDSYFGPFNGRAIDITHTVTVDNTGHVIQNCVTNGMVGRHISTERVGGITIKNCTLISGTVGIRVAVALTGGQTVTVNNCILVGLISVALQAVNVGEIIENFNAFSSNVANRTNVDTGANSNAFPALFDPRWFFELVGGKGRMVSPSDLASYSQLVNLAGTSPTTTDLRGTAVIGAQREWGALEYDPDLKLRASRARFLIGIG